MDFFIIKIKKLITCIRKLSHLRLNKLLVSKSYPYNKVTGCLEESSGVAASMI